jgi:uncharacterized OB-fold protein
MNKHNDAPLPRYTPPEGSTIEQAAVGLVRLADTEGMAVMEYGDIFFMVEAGIKVEEVAG